MPVRRCAISNFGEHSLVNSAIVGGSISLWVLNVTHISFPYEMKGAI